VGESLRQFLLTLWNTYSFFVLYANAEGLQIADVEELPGDGGSDLDRWIVSRLQRLVAIVIERLDDYDCTTAGREIAAYVEELSNWYVRLNRRRFWEGDEAAFATLRHCLIEVAKLLAPFIPFAADEIYCNLASGTSAGDDSVHLRDFPEPDPGLADAALEAGVAAGLRAIELGRAARAAAQVKNRQPRPSPRGPRSSASESSSPGS
jgi:isoleucyl-tRNA synthetase